MNTVAKKTKQRLMWLFAILTMIFLLLFVVIAYVTVSRSVLSDQKEKVTEMISDESIVHLLHESNESHDREMKVKLFAVVDSNGNVLKEEGDHIDQLIEGWTPESQVIVEKDEAGRDYLMAAKPVGDGYVFTGMDITQQKEVLKRLFVVLLLLTILFTFAAMILSFFMAGRAILPIVKSAERQREFVNDASHELRTPLSILSAGFQVVEEEDHLLSDFSKQTMHDMSGEVKRMTGLVNDLLLLARSDSGKLVLEKEEFNLTDLISKSVRSFTKVAEEHHLSITDDLQENVRFIGDKQRIQQLIYLFLDNAVKYNCEKGSIEVKLSEAEKKVRMSFIDSGVGIAEEHKRKIFDRFYRIDKARSRTMGSNGIGLSIADYIVKAHKGHIEVDSTLGKGTRFTVVLPI